MRIKKFAAYRKSLQEFAEENGLLMEVHERNREDLGSRWSEDLRYYAHFEDCDIKDGPILTCAFGDGATPVEAMANYAERISNKKLAFKVGTAFRFELDAPELHYDYNIR